MVGYFMEPPCTEGGGRCVVDSNWSVIICEIHYLYRMLAFRYSNVLKVDKHGIMVHFECVYLLQ